MPQVLVLASLAALLLGLSMANAAGPSAVADALQRPALMVKQPARGVMLGATRTGDRLVAVGERGLIVISDDGGATWRQAPSPVAVTLTAVRFADALNGVAVGHGATVLTTSDGGSTWTARLDGRRVAQLALDAAKISSDPAKVKEAERLVADGPDKPFLDVAMWDAQRILAVGAYGIAFHTSDGGKTWLPWMDRLPNPKGQHLYVLRRLGNTMLVAGEQGLLLRSDDAGTSFKTLVSPYRGSWFAAELLATGEWILGGLRGNVWQSTDAGATWGQVAVPMPASILATAVAPDGSLLLANQAGHVLRREGGRLIPITREPLPPLANLAFDRDGRLLAFGLAGVTSVAPSR